MAKFLVFFVVCLTHSLFALGAKRGNCDYTFGDPTWNHSKVFYDKIIKFPAGAKTHTVILPAQKGLMVSYVCIKLPPGIDRFDTKMSYHALDREVSVELAEPANKEFKYHVSARRHGI